VLEPFMDSLDAGLQSHERGRGDWSGVRIAGMGRDDRLRAPAGSRSGGLSQEPGDIGPKAVRVGRVE
jgi:hypothetical protein